MGIDFSIIKNLQKTNFFIILSIPTSLAGFKIKEKIKE